MLRRLFSNKPITKLAMQPPSPHGDRSGLALMLIVQNEERHIGEWLRFHLLAGLQHVFVYDNGCTDATIRILKQVGADQVTVIPWDQKLSDHITGREIHNQVLAYAHGLRNYGGAFRWMAAIDADEFLVPKVANDINAALQALEACGSITVPWHNFGRNGHDEIPKGGVLENYTQRVADPMSGARGVTNFKTIVDPCRVTAVRVHSYEIDGQALTWNDQGVQEQNAKRGDHTFYSADHIQLNHYYTRSGAELAAKIARGSNQTVEAKRHAARVRRNVENIEAKQFEDRSALEFLQRIGASTPL